MNRTAANPPIHYWSARCRLSHCRLCHRSLRCWSSRLQSSRLLSYRCRSSRRRSFRPIAVPPQPQLPFLWPRPRPPHTTLVTAVNLSRRCQPSRPPSWPRPRPATTVTVTAAAVAAQPLAATPRCREPLTGLGRHVAATPRPCPQQHPPQPSPRFMATGPAPSPLCG